MFRFVLAISLLIVAPNVHAENKSVESFVAHTGAKQIENLGDFITYVLHPSVEHPVAVIIWCAVCYRESYSHIERVLAEFSPGIERVYLRYPMIETAKITDLRDSYRLGVAEGSGAWGAPWVVIYRDRKPVADLMGSGNLDESALRALFNRVSHTPAKK
jgi:hypothetical protein